MQQLFNPVMPTRAPRNSHRLGESVKQALLPITLLTTTLGVLFGALDSLTKFVEMLETHFYVFISLCYAATLLLVWYWEPPRGKPFVAFRRWSRPILCTIVTLAFILGVGRTYYEYHVAKTEPARHPITTTPPRQVSSEVLNRLPKPAISHLVLESFNLNDDMSSFVETEDLLFAKSGPRYRTFAFDNTVTAAFKEGACIGARGNRPIEEVLPLLKRRLESTAQKDLQRYLETPEDLSRVIRNRGDVFTKIMFTPTDLEKLRRDSPADYRVVREWLLNCIGLQQPVLTLTVSNTSTKSVLLTHVIYHVLKVGGVKGGVSGPVVPDQTYDHILKHEPGDQSWALKPPLQIAAQERIAFNLRLFSASAEPGLGWLLQIEVLAADGDSVTTKPVQVIMGK